MKPRCATLPAVVRHCGLALLCALFATAPAFAQSLAASAVSIHDAGNPRGVLPGWNLAIGGEWPTQCPPVLQSVTLDGNDLRIDARSVLDLCARQPTAFSIEVNPTLALERLALAPGVYKVGFYAAEGVQAQPKLRAFALVDHSLPGAPSIVPETGFWWSAGADPTVLSMELQGGQLSVALLSYDADGQPAWLFGSAAFDGRIAHLPLLRLAGGSDPFAKSTATPHGDAAMTLDLQFSASAHAQAWLSRSRGDDGSLQLRALDLSRLPLAASTDGSAWQGDWVLVSDAQGAMPQRLRLDRSQGPDTQHIRIASADGSATLDCDAGSAQAAWPPRACTLQLADGSIDRFDSVAVTRMDGTDANGAAVHLLRIKP
ncbi:MAG: hypothetical protein JSS33_11960 [Proteobacteria bacterium]|nr:hypothetical protein [Pseudomonadota bacterium]